MLPEPSLNYYFSFLLDFSLQCVIPISTETHLKFYPIKRYYFDSPSPPVIIIFFPCLVKSWVH